MERRRNAPFFIVMIQFFFSSWRAGFRNKGLFAVFALGIALVFVAYLAAFFSPRQPRTVALDVGLSGLRFCLVFFSTLLVHDLVGKEIERRVIVLALSYPVRRVDYLLGRYFGVLALGGLAALILGLLLWIAILLSAVSYDQQYDVSLGIAYWIAIFGIWLDVAVVCAFTLLVATLSTIPMLPLALGALFAIAGRAIGPVFDFVAKGAEGQTDIATTYSPVLNVARFMIPDLSRLDWRAWPMYGQGADYETMAIACVLALAYAAGILALASQALSRREFS